MPRIVQPRSEDLELKVELNVDKDLIDLTCTTHLCKLVRFDGKFGCPRCSKELKSNPWAGTLLAEYKLHMNRIKKVS